MSARSLFDRLLRAREALAKARARGEDPWRLAELQDAHDRLAEAAADAGPEPELQHVVPSPRRPVEAVPLSWVDESGRVRPRRGEA
jgi:hypothetical protein